MRLYFVQHEKNNRCFLFTDNGDSFFTNGDDVVCSTKYGEKRGTVMVSISGDDKKAEIIALSCGAYWPLAKILRKYIKPFVTSIDDVPEYIVRQIREQERAELIARLHPFCDDVVSVSKVKSQFDL